MCFFPRAIDIAIMLLPILDMKSKVLSSVVNLINSNQELNMYSLFFVASDSDYGYVSTNELHSGAENISNWNKMY